jgi:DNA repair exonuclease SbcCD ATPase subunit
MAKQVSNDEIAIPVEATEAFMDAANEVAPQPTSKVFTAEEVEGIRKQEKDKLYKRLEESETRSKTMEEQLRTLSEEREQAIRQAQEQARKEEEIRRQREFEELSAKELLKRAEDEFNVKIQSIDQEWQSRFEMIEAERRAQEALLEKERTLRDLETYRQRRIHESSEEIIPELIDLVAGNTVDEIDSSVEILRQRSAAIINSIQQATQASRVKGAAVTSPSVGPMETQTEYQTLNADDIRNMSMDQYVKMRDRLLSSRPKGRF